MGGNLLISTGASNEVPSNLNIYQGSAWNAIGNAREALNSMTNSIPGLPESTVNPGQSTGVIAYNKNGQPPVWDFSFNPPVFDVSSPVLEEIITTPVEDFTGLPPAYTSPNIPIRPNPVYPAKPVDAPIINDLVIPSPPIKGTVAEPKEYAISIPLTPVINIKDFAGKLPVSNITKPDGSFNWQEDPYTSQTLDSIISNVDTYLSGGVGMPDATWELIWAKDNDREQRAGITLRSEINKEFSDKGFQGLPQGVQVGRLDKVNIAIFNGSQERSRGISIKESELAIENLRFAVTQGIALEQLRGSWYQAGLSRLFDAAKYSSELAVSVFNAEISFYNMQLQAYVAELDGWKKEIDAELSKLEVYKSELEGQKIIGELNQQEVDKYVARLNALTIDLEYYNSSLESLKLITENDALKVDAYGKTIQAYGEEVKAITSQYSGYNTAMQGAKIEADISQTNVQAFSVSVDAYSKKNSVEIAKSQIGIDINNQLLKEYDSLLNGYSESMKSELSKLDAAQKEHQNKTSTFSSNLDSEKSSLAAQIASRAADAQNAAQITQANIQNAKTNASNALSEMQATLGVYQAISSVEGAYSNAALSAVNLSMSMGDSASNSATLDP